MDKNFESLSHSKSSLHWKFRGGYTTTDEETDPRRVVGLKDSSGVSLTLWIDDIDIDHICRGNLQGYRVTLHSPGDIPRVSKEYFRIPLKKEVTVIVKPNMIKTSEGLRSYSPARRQCLFDNKKDLQFFKIYSQSNCELECLTNFTLNSCGSVKFSIPRAEGTILASLGKSKDEKEAMNLMRDINREFIEEIFKSALAEWNFASNITKDTAEAKAIGQRKCASFREAKVA